MASTVLIAGCTHKPSYELFCDSPGFPNHNWLDGVWNYERKSGLTYTETTIFIGCETITTNSFNIIGSLPSSKECTGSYTFKEDSIHINGTCGRTKDMWKEVIGAKYVNGKLALRFNKNSNAIFDINRDTELLFKKI